MTSKQNKGFKSAYSKPVLKAAIEVKGCQNCSAVLDSDSSASMEGSFDKAPLKHHCCCQQKSRLNEDKVVDNEPEEHAIEIVDSEEPQDERQGTMQKKNKVSGKW